MRLPHLDLFPLGFADNESAASQIFRFIQFVVRQKISPKDLNDQSSKLLQPVCSTLVCSTIVARIILK
jgi:hypothetical protein